MARMYLTLILLNIGNVLSQLAVSKGPPPHQEMAATARYVINNAGWGVIGTISTIPNLEGRPFTNIISISDGPIGNGTGIPYMYIMKMDPTAKDILANSKVSLTVSEAVFGYCQSKGWDPEDPRCARLTLTGRMVNVTQSEKQKALSYLFERHPAMRDWGEAHDFYPTKLVIDMVWLLDYFGGVKTISLKDYFAANNAVGLADDSNKIRV